MAKKIIDIRKENRKFIDRVNKINNLNNNMNPFSNYYMDNEFKKKYMEFSKDTEVLSSMYSNSKNSKYLKPSNIESSYSKISDMFHAISNVKNFTNKTNTGESLIQSTMDMDISFNHYNVTSKINTPVPELIKTYDNFKKADNFISFDTETLSGIGKTGNNELDMIQELSLRFYNKGTNGPIEDASKRLETLIGFGLEEKKAYEDIFINGFNENGWQGVQKNSVIANRLAKLGHKDTTIEMNKNTGVALTKTFASDDAINLMSTENIQRGIDRSYEIYKMQNTSKLSNGLMAWEDMLLKSVHEINNNISVGYNTVNFDYEKINQQVAKVWTGLNDEQKKQYEKKFNLKKGEIPTIDPLDNTHLDLMDVTKLAGEADGKASLHDNDYDKLESLKISKKTALQQESLAASHVGESISTAAHTAGEDVNVLASLAYNGKEKSLLDKAMETVANNYNSENDTTINKNSILVATQGEQFNEWTRKGAFNFSEETLNNRIMLGNGIAIKNGMAEDLGQYGKARGIKKNVAYQIQSMKKVNMSEKWIDSVSDINPEYAQGSLYSLTLQGIAKDGNEGKEINEPITYLFTSKEKMHGFASSHFDNVGTFNENGKPVISDSEDIIKKYSTGTIDESGYVINKNATIDDILKKSEYKIKNDTAARMSRDLDINKARKMIKLNDHFVSKGITNPIEQQQQMGMAIANKVKNGEALKIKHDLFNILGYGPEDNKKLWQSTLGNFINSHQYNESLIDTYKQVINHVDSLGNLTTQQQQTTFETIMNGILEDADLDFGNSKSKANIYLKDANYFDFNLPQGYLKNNALGMQDEATDVFRVDLNNGKEYSLVNNILQKRRGNNFNNKIIKEEYGKAELIDFMKTVNGTEEYKGMFDELLSGKNITSIVGEIHKNKDLKNELRKRHFEKLDNMMDGVINNDPKIKEARNIVNVLKEKHIQETNKVANYDLKGVSNELSNLNKSFKVYGEEDWAKLDSTEKAKIKLEHKNIMKQQEELLAIFADKKDEIEKVSNIGNQLDNAYKDLFTLLDGERSGAKKTYIKEYKDMTNSLNKNIDELYKNLNENTVGIASKNINTDIIGEKMISAIKEHRERHPQVGYINEVTNHDVSKPYINADKLTNEYVAQKIKYHSEKIPNISVIKTDKNNLNMQVEKIVDEILMPKVFNNDGSLTFNIDEIVNHAAHIYNYNTEQEKILKSTLLLHRQDHIKGISKMTKGVLENGGKLSYNKSTGELFATMNNETVSLHGIPRTKYHNGIIYNQTGVTKVGASFDFDIASAIHGNSLKTNEVKATSILNDAYKELQYTGSNIKRATNNNESPIKVLLRDVGKVAEKVREIPTISNSTAKDTISHTRVKTSKFLEAVPYVLDKMKAYDDWMDKDMIKIFEKNSDAMKNGVYISDVLEAYNKNKQDIAKIVLGLGAGEENNQKTLEEFLIANLNNYGKANIIANGDAHLGKYQPLPFLEFDNPSRPPISSLDNKLYSKNEIEKKLNNENLKGRVSTDLKIVSKQREKNRVFDGVGDVVDSFEFKNAGISEKNFKNIIRNKYEALMNDINLSPKKKEELKKIYEQVKGYNLTEQGKILDGYIGDALLDKTETQVIGTLKDFNYSNEIISKEMKSRINNSMPTIEVVNNKIEFKLAEEQFVKRGDPLLAKNSYGGVVTTIGVKEDAGLFGLRYYSKNSNIEVSQEHINKVLNNHIGKIVSEDGKINYANAGKILDNEFDSKFRVENVFIKGYNKGTAEAAEKGMYSLLLSGAGTASKEVEDILENTGLGQYKGKILGNNFIDNILKKEYLKKYDESTWEDAVKKINAEKFATSDFIRGIKGLEDIGSISIDNMSKHGNAGIALKQFIHTSAEHFMTVEELDEKSAYKKVYKALKDKDIIHGYDFNFDEKKGRIVTNGFKKGEEVFINKDEINKLSNEIGTYSRNSKNPLAIMDGDQVVGFKTKYATSFNENFSGTSRSNNLIEGLKDELSEKRKERRVALKSKDTDKVDTLDDEIKDLNSRIGAAISSDKKMKVSSREVNMLGLRKYTKENMEHVQKVLGDEKFKDIFNPILNEDGVLSKEALGSKVHSEFIDDIKNRAVEKASKNEVKDEIMAAKKAIEFNKDPVRMNIDEMKKDYSIEKIQDIVPATGENTAFIKELPNRSMGRNVLVDTGLNGEHKYVAMPANDIKMNGDTITNDEIQKSFVKMQGAHERYNLAIEGDNDVLRNGTTVNDVKAKYMESIDNFKKSIVTQTRKNVETLDNVKIGNYSYEDASMAMLNLEDLNKAKHNGRWLGEKSYNMYGVSQIEGKSIGQWASEGVHYDASWHGKEYFKNLGFFDKDVLKKHNMTEKGMEKHLALNGIAGIETRTPTIMDGSTSMVRQFLDVGAKDGVSISTPSLALGRNQDHDGDKVIQAVLEKDGYTSLDYDLNKKAVPEDVSKYFKSNEMAMTHRATTANPKIFTDAEKIFEVKEPEMAINNDLEGVLASEKLNTNAEGRIIPFSEVEADTYTRNRHKKLYDEVSNKAIERMGEDNFNNLNPLTKSNEIYKEINNLGDEADKEAYKVAARFMETYQKDAGATMTKVAGSASIGFINTPLYNFRLFAQSEGLGAESQDNIQAMANIVEQKIISKKHSTDYLISVTQDFRDNVNKMISGNKDGLNGIHTLIDNHSDDIVEMFKNTASTASNNMADENIIDSIKKSFTDMHSIFVKDPLAKTRFEANSLNKKLTDNNAEVLFKSIDENSASLSSYSMAKAGYNEAGRNISASPLMEDFKINNSESKKVVSNVAEEVVEGVENAAHSSKGLAKAALGLAAAVMAVGYIGGNPTAPSESQAQDMDNYDSLQDKDLNIQQMPQQGTGEGYVININAQSSKGQQHAMDAIQHAMESSVPVDVNVAMNIKDKTSNITSRYIDKLLTGAI